MSDIIPGHVFIPGESVDAPALNEHVADAVIAAAFISDKILKDPASLSDKLVIEEGGNLKAITLQQISDLITPLITQQFVPVGSITFFAGANAPTNWMFTYGQAIDRDIYSDLFTAIGVTYGAGNGTTTFALPDLRGRVIAAKQDMGGVSSALLGAIIAGSTLNAKGGTERITLSINEMPAHTHGADRIQYAGNVKGGSGTFTPFASTTDSQGGSQPHSNLQPTIILNAIIKVL